MSTAVSSRARRWPWSPLTVRLMLAQTAVLAIGLIIVVITAVLIGPRMFYHELVESGHADEALGLVHLEDAFRSVSLTALTIGGLPALYIAGMLTFYLYRMIGRSLASFSTAAGEVAVGNYDVRVTSTKLGPEFDSLAGSFNDMAAKLDAVDTTRRQMLADLAHEMRTPLASLKGHLRPVQRHRPDPGMVRQPRAVPSQPWRQSYDQHRPAYGCRDSAEAGLRRSGLRGQAIGPRQDPHRSDATATTEDLGPSLCRSARR